MLIFSIISYKITPIKNVVYPRQSDIYKKGRKKPKCYPIPPIMTITL